jgi:hypothetical protein
VFRDPLEGIGAPAGNVVLDLFGAEPAGADRYEELLTGSVDPAQDVRLPVAGRETIRHEFRLVDQ